jgi:hypothetical protein
MSILPNCVIGDIELEIKNRIQGNLVYCQVDPKSIYEETFEILADSYAGGTIGGVAASHQAVCADI